jgi:hypothetical protein
MPIHLFTSSNPNQRFQPGCAADMIQFFNGEAVVESDEVAAELDSLIARGRIPEIARLKIGDKEAELAAAEAKAASLRHVLAQLNAGGMPDEALGRGGINSGAVVGVTTTGGVPQGKESIGDVYAILAEPKKQAN